MWASKTKVPKDAHMLTIKQIEAAKAQEKPYKLSDGGGLHLYISTTGAKSWRLKYRFNKKIAGVWALSIGDFIRGEKG